MRPNWRSERIATGVALLVTVAILFLHFVFGTHAGALWRDEVNSLEIATMSTLAEMWSNLAFDSFPTLFFLVLRCFAGVVNISDNMLRGFGVGAGFLVLGALWLNARWLGYRVPLISLVLVGMNPMVIRYGDSIRAYGLGIALMLLTLGAMWRLVEEFTTRRVVMATLAALLSVQCLYYNAVLLFAIGVSAAIVTLRRGALKQTVVVLMVGVVSAASLFPYLGTMRRVQMGSFIWKAPVTPAELWKKLSGTLGSPLPFAAWVWIALLVLAVLIGIWAIWRRIPFQAGVRPNDRLLFALLALASGTAVYILFLKALGYLTQPWYYILFVAYAGTCLEMLFASVRAHSAWVARSVFAFVFAAITIVPAWRTLQARQTNVDLVATRLATLAAEGDLIVINTWNYGISFRRYYHGRADWLTIPPLEDLRTHRVDLVKNQMMAAAPLVPVHRKMEETLKTGHTVWLVGTLDFVAKGTTPNQLPPGYDGPEGWVGGNFFRAWAEQTGFLVQEHASQFERVRIPNDEPVLAYENLPVSAIRGWR